MKALLVDADSQKDFPNLALMKISAWLKRNGYSVDLIKGVPKAAPLETYDKYYISTIFFQNRELVLDYARQLPKKPYIGGSGYSNKSKLSKSIEHILPDYSLYNVDYSMGFTSRGCVRKCPWCIVPLKEGYIRDNASLGEFLHPDHNKLILLDNNFQASPRWRENLQEIIDRKIRVNFNQGLDARLVNAEFASMLAESKCYDWHFRIRGAHLAFDSLNVEQPLINALSLFENAGMPPKRFIVYILVGHHTTFDQDIYRVEKVIELGAKPYIMRFNQNPNTILKHLARWVNRKYYEFVDRTAYNGGVLA